MVLDQGAALAEVAMMVLAQGADVTKVAVMVLAQGAAVAQVAVMVLAQGAAATVAQDLKQVRGYAQHRQPEVLSSRDSQPPGMI